MKIIDLPQKSPEWKEWRTTVFTASNAPAMMGASTHTSRLELLDFYDSGTKAPVNQYTQELFDGATHGGQRGLSQRRKPAAVQQADYAR